MEVFVSETGFCWGIDLAYQRIANLAGQGGPLKATHRGGADAHWDTVQRIAHDPDLVARYPALAGVTVNDDLDFMGAGDVAAIGHQGIDRKKIDAAKARGVVVNDHKCPFIAKFDKSVDALIKDGHDVIAFGKPKNHHCQYAREAAQEAGRACVIAEDLADIEAELKTPGRNWAAVGQVTGNVGVWEKFKRGLETLGVPVRVVDTVCTDSHSRQAEAAALAARVDAVVVVDDGGGATVSVFETVSAVNPKSFRYDPRLPLPVKQLKGVRSVAVVCGILVPKWILDRVADDIRKLPAA